MNGCETDTRVWTIYAPRVGVGTAPLSVLAYYRGTEAELVAFLPRTFDYSWSYDERDPLRVRLSGQP